MNTSSTLPYQGSTDAPGKGEQFASVTRKGQITLPVEVRRSLGVAEGDKIAVSVVHGSEDDKPQVVQAILKPVHSVAQMTYGAIGAIAPHHPEHPEPADFKVLRRAFEQGTAEQVSKQVSKEAPSLSTFGAKQKSK